MSVAVREKPILFSSPMVRAILEGRKTQTRRVMKGNFAPEEFIRKESGSGYRWYCPRREGRNNVWTMTGAVGVARDAGFDTAITCPYGFPRDRLWVRETWRPYPGGYFEYRANFKDPGKGWKPSIFMPREACRIRLEVRELWCQRLQEITEEDARAEGFESTAVYDSDQSENYTGITAKESFRALWNKLNAKRGFGWSENPWVWCVGFSVLKGA